MRATPSCFEPLLAGTLALLHQLATVEPARPPCGYTAAKLAYKLEQLAEHPGVSAALAAVLSRLAAQWSQRAVALLEGDGKPALQAACPFPLQ
jgi:hypothetical protein